MPRDDALAVRWFAAAAAQGDADAQFCLGLAHELGRAGGGRPDAAAAAQWYGRAAAQGSLRATAALARVTAGGEGADADAAAGCATVRGKA